MRTTQEFLNRFSRQKREISRLWNICRETADFIAFLIKLHKPLYILEIGTSNGFSAFCMSLAAEEFSTEIYTIECDEERYRLAKDNLAGKEKIKIRYGKAEEIIPELKHKYDFVFLDANKEQYHLYLELLKPHLANNALIVADNVHSHQHSVKEYIRKVRNDPNLTSLAIPIGSGLEITLYRTGE